MVLLPGIIVGTKGNECPAQELAHSSTSFLTLPALGKETTKSSDTCLLTGENLCHLKCWQNRQAHQGAC